MEKPIIYYIRSQGKFLVLEGKDVRKVDLQFSSYAAMRKAVKSTFRLKRKMFHN